MLLRRSDLEEANREQRLRQSSEIDRIDQRLDHIELRWLELVDQNDKWKRWLSGLMFAMATSSLVLAGIYLGGVLF